MSVHSDEPATPDVDTAADGALEVSPHAADRGASAVEYALLIGLIALVIFAAMALLGVNVTELYSSIATGY